jgi:hypothetical protein
MASKMNDTSNTDREVANAGKTEGATLEMVLWTRRPVCGPRTAVIDQLSSLAASGDIGGFRVETWPDELAMSEHTEHNQVVERYKEFLLWAEENDCSITPPFERRTVSPLIGKRRDVLTLPIMCLAVYEDDTLCGVYPHSEDGETISVTDFLTNCVDTDTVVRSDTTVSVDP